MFGAIAVPSRCLRCLRNPSLLLRIPSRQNRLQSSATGLSNALLNRARSVAKEHDSLSQRLLENFDPKIAKRMGELAPITRALKEWEIANESIAELESLLNDPETDSELRSLAIEDLDQTKSKLPAASEELKKSLIPKHPFAPLPCLLEIRPGAGGDEAGLFAYELLKMYISFCSRHGLRTIIIKKDMEDGTADDRLTEAVMEVETPGSYDILRTEIGVHRVQRVPTTETKGRTHTSAVSVMILPSFPETGGEDGSFNFEDPNSDYYVDPQEVRSEKMRASGAGGQHVNKTESAIRLTHIPTGIAISMQDSRSQHANRKKAWQVLRAKLAEKRREAREEEMVKLRRGAMGGVAKMGRGDKVRTYNFSQSRCTDHRSGSTVHDLTSVLDGGFGLETIMDSVRKWLVDREVEVMITEEQTGKN
ncbi:putative mitochondrial translation release factor [Talaromyces proteolyticus]|uniref:Mitochondrial translation release factor n=1 Tax=Talaromyces proteolyticus TaxID=1131652 RepID=A0AAD4PTK9_9EURO|nr:putative mitochondrial translation release factor [Talaromyces proteolyticus]KAH8688878.1 putative mitochondrial translation release factor [Talaromyces proteolyticus]